MFKLSKLFKKINKTEDKNNLLFELGDELNKLESERVKLCAKLGDGVYKSNSDNQITQDFTEIRTIDHKIEQKRKELKNIELTYKNQRGESDE